MNKYKYIIIDGKEYISVTTNGINKKDFIVDKNLWNKYLHKYNWTCQIKALGRKTDIIYITTTINNCQRTITDIIFENEYDEIDRYNMVVDHINNNRLDNRMCNLRLVCRDINMANINGKLLYEYKTYYLVSATINKEKIFKTFSFKKYNGKENALIEANKYIKYIKYLKEQYIKDSYKKHRDLSFEQSLRNKIANNEIEEIKTILMKYEII